MNKQQEISEKYLKPYLHLSDISKEFRNTIPYYSAVKGFELRVLKGEFVSVIGHSGCGKSTVLMIAAGLDNATGGGVILENKLVDSPGPDRGVVFQSPSVFPWMTALENVMIGANQVYPNTLETVREELCLYYLARVGLGDAAHQRAGQMSAGMKQRVSLARAFALKPKLLLLDEPFGMLDSLTRAELQEVLLEVWNTEKITAMMVTHDVDEALFLSDRIVMMTSGPDAKIGGILDVPFERPRRKEEVIDRPDYYKLRGQLIDFLEGKKKTEPPMPARLVPMSV